MKIQNIFGDITVQKTAEKFEIEAYPEDMKEIERYVNFKSQALGGKVPVAEIINKMTRALRFDLDYVASVSPDLVPPKAVKKEKLTKRDTEMPLA